MNINILLTGLLLTQVMALYEHQIGLHDWVLRQFGELENVQVDSLIYFKSRTHIGSINKANGQLIKSQSLPFVECIEKSPIYLGSQYVYYDQEQQRVTLYKQKEDLHKVLIQHELEQPLIGCFNLGADAFVLITSQRGIHVVDGQVAKQEIFKDGYSPISVAYQQSVPTVLLQSANRVCVVEVVVQHSIFSEIASQACKSRQGESKFRRIGDAYLHWDERSVSLLTHQLVETLPSSYIGLLKMQSQVFEYGRLFTAVIDFKHVLYSFTADEPKPIHEFAYGVAFDLAPQGRFAPTQVFYVKPETKKAYLRSFDTQTKLETTIGDVDLNTEAQPLKLFVRGSEPSKRLFIVQHRDLYTYAYSAKESRQIWSSEQSLSRIAAVLWEPFADEEQEKPNSYYESLEVNGAQNPLHVVQNLVRRFTADFNDLVHYAQSVPLRMTRFAQELMQLRLKGGTTAAQRAQSKEYDITYGLRQKIILITELKTILCYDSEDGELLWKDTSMVGRMDGSYTLKGHFHIELKNVHREHSDGKAPLSHVLIYHSEQAQRLNIFVLNPSTGELMQVASQASSRPEHLQSYRVQHEKSQYDNLVMIWNVDGDLITYPRVPLEAIGLGRTPLITFSYDETTRVIKGTTFIGDGLVPTWNFRVGSSETILRIRSSYLKGEENPRIALWDDRRVLFKVIDFSNFAVLTHDTERGIMNLYIVNAASGKVLFQGVQKSVDFNLPINLVYDENSVFVTFFNPTTTIYEIWTVELFHQNIEVSFLRILEDYYFNKKEETQLNYFENELKCVFLQQIYGYPLGIKKLSIARTLRSFTKKNLIVITPQDQVALHYHDKIHSLDRHWVSTRRKRSPTAAIPDTSFESADLPPYQYLLGTNFQNVLNYHQELSNMDSFYIQPTNLESTSLLLVSGDDLFFTRISPDKTYDMIQPDFNYSLLLLTVVLIVGLSYFTRSLARSSKIIKVFYSS